MKYQSEVTVLGMKANKGTMDNGTAFDSTKAYVVLDMDTSKGNALGQSAGEFNFGTSAEIEKFRGQSFPFKARGDFEIVTNGKTTKTVLHALSPVEVKRG